MQVVLVVFIFLLGMGMLAYNSISSIRMASLHDIAVLFLVIAVIIIVLKIIRNEVGYAYIHKWARSNNYEIKKIRNSLLISFSSPYFWSIKHNGFVYHITVLDSNNIIKKGWVHLRLTPFLPYEIEVRWE